MLLWLDSYDDRTAPGGNDSVVGSKYDAHNGVGGVNSATARTGAHGVTLYNMAYFQKNVPQGNTFIIGFACKLNAASSAAKFLRIQDSGTDQVYLQCNTDSTVSLCNGSGTVLATTAVTFSASVYAFLELKIVINASTGTYTLMRDGVVLLAASGVNTQNTGNATANQILLTWTVNSSGGMDIDDYYICDNQGGINTDFMGATFHVECLKPSGSGNTSQWSIGGSSPAGTTYGSINESTPDDGVTLISDNTPGEKSTFAMNDLSTTSVTIAGIQTKLRAQNDMAGVRTVSKVLRSGGADYDGAAKSFTTSWADYMEIDEVDPATSARWLPAAVNALEAGVKIET